MSKHEAAKRMFKIDVFTVFSSRSSQFKILSIFTFITCKKVPNKHLLVQSQQQKKKGVKYVQS